MYNMSSGYSHYQPSNGSVNISVQKSTLNYNQNKRERGGGNYKNQNNRSNDRYNSSNQKRGGGEGESGHNNNNNSKYFQLDMIKDPWQYIIKNKISNGEIHSSEINKQFCNFQQENNINLAENSFSIHEFDPQLQHLHSFTIPQPPPFLNIHQSTNISKISQNQKFILTLPKEKKSKDDPNAIDIDI